MLRNSSTVSFDLLSNTAITDNNKNYYESLLLLHMIYGFSSSISRQFQDCLNFVFIPINLLIDLPIQSRGKDFVSNLLFF